MDRQKFSFTFVIFIVFLLILTKSEAFIFKMIKPKVLKICSSVQTFFDIIQKEIPKLEKVFHDTVSSIESNRLFDYNFSNSSTD